jgi:hypothetical protein
MAMLGATGTAECRIERKRPSDECVGAILQNNTGFFPNDPTLHAADCIRDGACDLSD